LRLQSLKFQTVGEYGHTVDFNPASNGWVVLALIMEYPITVQVALALIATVIGIVPVAGATVQYLNIHVPSGLLVVHVNL
jgi:hypothetical protein